MKYLSTLLLIFLILIAFLSCGDKSTELTIDTRIGGEYSISGKIELPEGFKKDSIAFLTFYKVSGEKSPWNEFKRGIINSQTVDYKINNLSDGEYLVKFTVDQNMSQKLSDPGDYEGFYNGKMDRTQADKIVISGASISEIDFKIATLQ